MKLMRGVMVAGIAMFVLSSAAVAQNLPSCGKFAYWRVGQECIGKNGKVCTITGFQGGYTILSCK